MDAPRGYLSRAFLPFRGAFGSLIRRILLFLAELSGKTCPCPLWKERGRSSRFQALFSLDEEPLELEEELFEEELFEEELFEEELVGGRAVGGGITGGGITGGGAVSRRLGGSLRR